MHLHFSPVSEGQAAAPAGLPGICVEQLAPQEHSKDQLLPQEWVGKVGKRSSSDAGNYNGCSLPSLQAPTAPISLSLGTAAKPTSSTDTPSPPLHSCSHHLWKQKHFFSAMCDFEVDGFYFTHTHTEPPEHLKVFQPFPTPYRRL